MDPELIKQIYQAMRLGYRADGSRMDAAAVTNGTLFLERELTQVTNKVLEVKYPENKAITFIPLDTKISPFAETYTWKVQNSWGQARIINGDETSLPTVGTDAVEKQGTVISLGLSYGWTRNELLTAQWLNQPLSDRLAMAARRGIEISLDELLRTGKLASTGQTANGLGGFCNNASVGRASTFTNWLSVGSPPTPLQIYNDLVAFTNKPKANTNEIYESDTLIVASALYDKIAFTPMFATGSETTILKYFLQNSPNIRNVSSWKRLDGTGDGTIGTSGYHQMITYKYSPEVLEGIVPVRFDQLPAQVQGLRTNIPCVAKCGGVKIYVPAAMEYGFVNNSTT